MTHLGIVSGGQTGVDRGALDAALDAGVECGGWCPRGRRAEDGAIPARYPLRETGSAGYAVRTRRNVRDSDATLIIVRHGRELTDGTQLTAEEARRLGRPLLIVELGAHDPPKEAVTRVVSWLASHDVGVLNVAGPRESKSPGIEAEARALVAAVLGTATR